MCVVFFSRLSVLTGKQVASVAIHVKVILIGLF